MAQRGLEQKSVFFIVGAPRSGTTLLQNMLSAHSKIHIPPETEFFMSAAPAIDRANERGDEEAALSALRRWVDGQRFQDQGLDGDGLINEAKSAGAAMTSGAAFSAFIAMVQSDSGKPRVGEKSPHHYRHIEIILRSVPEAQFIHIVRDPRDVIASRLRMSWSTGSHFAIAREWNAMAELHDRYCSQLSQSAYVTVRYEDLIEDPEHELRKLTSFLGESYEEQMLMYDRESTAQFTNREEEWKKRAAQPISKGRVGAYQHDLSPRQIRGIELICKNRMDLFGYTLDSPSSPHRLTWVVQDICDRSKDIAVRWRRSLAKRIRNREQ